MSNPVNEFMNLPMVSPAPMGDAVQDIAPAPSDTSVVVGAPMNMHDPKYVSVWTDSITPVSYTIDSEVATFDIVFTVGICTPDGSRTKTYKVVKRIGIDKCKLACEAECTSPISIVENKKVDEAKETAKRFRRLAGLE